MIRGFDKFELIWFEFKFVIKISYGIKQHQHQLRPHLIWFSVRQSAESTPYAPYHALKSPQNYSNEELRPWYTSYFSGVRIQQ